MSAPMQMHASCVARQEAGVLLLGPSGSGKSDLALRLVDQGFMLVADDRVTIDQGIARPPPRLAGLLEVRGVGIFRLPYRRTARLALAIELCTRRERLPERRDVPALGIPLARVDARAAGAVAQVMVALAAAREGLSCLAGGFQAPSGGRVPERTSVVGPVAVARVAT